METNELTAKLIKQFGSLQSARQPMEDIWQKEFELVDPANAFITRAYHPKDIIARNLYSTQALRAVPKFVAAMHSTVTPANQRWHRTTSPTENLKDNVKCEAWQDKLTANMFEMRYRAKAGFNEAFINIYSNFAVVGHGVLFVDEVPGLGASYQSIPIENFYPVLNERNELVKCFNKSQLAYWELEEKLYAWDVNPKDKLPKELSDKGEDDAFIKSDIIHVVWKLNPKERLERSYKIMVEGKEVVQYYNYWSMYILTGCKEPIVLKEYGMFTMPYMYSRYKPIRKDVWSSSPTLQGMPDILMQQRMRKSIIQGGEKAVDPVLLAKRDKNLRGAVARAGAMINGGLSSDGTPNIKTLDQSGNLNIGIELEEVLGRSIEDYFLVPLYMMFLDKNNMTATEIQQRAFERAIMMSIVAYPIEASLLAPMIEREFDIMSRQDRLPDDMPDELEEIYAKGEPVYCVQYEGEAAKAQLLAECIGITQTMEQMALVSQFEPTIKETFDFYGFMMKLAKGNNVPNKYVKLTAKKYEELKKTIANQQSQAASLQTAAMAAEVENKMRQRSVGAVA